MDVAGDYFSLRECKKNVQVYQSYAQLTFPTPRITNRYIILQGPLFRSVYLRAPPPVLNAHVAGVEETNGEFGRSLGFVARR